MIEKFKISLNEFIRSILTLFGIYNINFSLHHQITAFISKTIGENYGLSDDRMKDLVFASFLHDIGAFSALDFIEFRKFTPRLPYIHNHSKIGYLLLRNFLEFKKIPKIILYHHVNWKEKEKIPFESHILHLSDRIQILIKNERDILSQSENIYIKISSQSGNLFSPELVYIFSKIYKEEYFWFEIKRFLYGEMDTLVDFSSIELNFYDFIFWCKNISKIIDFRSRFTAFHSTCIARVSSYISEIFGFSERERKIMEICGYLHDIGKIAIPLEILEKKGKLDKREFNIMKEHVYYTFLFLNRLNFPESIILNASLHHERNDGSGYPFGLKDEDIPLGAKILAVSDIFVALREERPHRKPLEKDEIIQLLEKISKEDKIERKVAEVFINNYDEIEDVRRDAIKEKEREYEEYKYLLKKDIFEIEEAKYE